MLKQILYSTTFLLMRLSSLLTNWNNKTAFYSLFILYETIHC